MKNSNAKKVLLGADIINGVQRLYEEDFPIISQDDFYTSLSGLKDEKIESCAWVDFEMAAKIEREYGISNL